MRAIAKRQRIVGVMGGGNCDRHTESAAYQLGRKIASCGWFLLNGGRNAGVMAASAKGAAEAGGITIGILPDADASDAAEHIHIPICTGMGSARNMINVLSSDVVVACKGGAGTISEIALALKHGKTVIAMGLKTGQLFDRYKRIESLVEVDTPEAAIHRIYTIFGEPPQD